MILTMFAYSLYRFTENTASILGAISALGLITIGIKNQGLVRKES